MNLFKTNCRYNKHGFTLVELIVVLVIIVILATIAIMSFTGYIGKAHDARLISICRSCVVAAQAITTENYASSDGDVKYPPTDDEVNQLAQIDTNNGSVLVITTDDEREVVTSLTYRDFKDGYVTYLREPTPQYIFSTGEEWKTGIAFNLGDTMTSNGYIFRCIRAHTTGTTSRTRDPSLRSNKSSWEVIGYTGDAKPYSSTVRYGVGLIVSYTDRTSGLTGYYRRKDFNLVGGQVPYVQVDSDYWEYIPPEEYTKYNITP